MAAIIGVADEGAPTITFMLSTTALECGDALDQRGIEAASRCQSETLAQGSNSGVIGTADERHAPVWHADLRQAAPIPLIADELSAKVGVEMVDRLQKIDRSACPADILNPRLVGGKLRLGRHGVGINQDHVEPGLTHAATGRCKGSRSKRDQRQQSETKPYAHTSPRLLTRAPMAKLV